MTVDDLRLYLAIGDSGVANLSRKFAFEFAGPEAKLSYRIPFGNR